MPFFSANALLRTSIAAAQFIAPWLQFFDNSQSNRLGRAYSALPVADPPWFVVRKVDGFRKCASYFAAAIIIAMIVPANCWHDLTTSQLSMCTRSVAELPVSRR